MKLAYVHGSAPLFGGDDSLVKEIVTGVFLEMEAEIAEIDLGRIHPPFFDGEATRAVDGAIEKMRASDGVVLASRTSFLSPCAILMNFLEYFGLPEYAGVLDGKHAMLLLFSRDGGEKSALAALSDTVSHLGAYAVTKIGLQARHLRDAAAADIVGKACEDFYRAVKLKRKYIIPRDFGGPAGAEPAKGAPKPKPSGARAAESGALTSEQEKNIDELAKLFAKKIGVDETEKAAPPPPKPRQKAAPPPPAKNREDILDDFPFNDEDEAAALLGSLDFEAALKKAAAAAAPQEKTAQQITRNLPDRFLPLLSAGLHAVIQMNIFGNEEFSGYLDIRSTDCAYHDGAAPAPDIVIMADSAMWLDVLNGKFTAQKAFMVGGLKVRGDFVLLSKFDNLFKL